MVRIHSDPTGCRAHLECDDCHRGHDVMLFASARALAADVLRVHDWLRAHRGIDWHVIHAPASPGEPPAWRDVCRRCRRRYRRLRGDGVFRPVDRPGSGPPGIPADG